MTTQFVGNIISLRWREETGIIFPSQVHAVEAMVRWPRSRQTPKIMIGEKGVRSGVLLKIRRAISAIAIFQQQFESSA